MSVSVIRFEKLSIEDLCDYIENKYYKPINLSLGLLEDYLEKSNLHEKDDDNIHGILRIIIGKLTTECNKLFKNDTIIVFPKIKSRTMLFSNETLSNFSKMHYSILEIIEKIKTLLNYYIPEPFWNVQTHIFASEMKTIESTFESVVYVKENYLWTKIREEHLVC